MPRPVTDAAQYRDLNLAGEEDRFLAMTIRFSTARLGDDLTAGHSPGWAVVRHESGQPNKYVSRMFLREQAAAEHAQRLMMQEAVRARKAATSA